MCKLYFKGFSLRVPHLSPLYSIIYRYADKKLSAIGAHILRHFPHVAAVAVFKIHGGQFTNAR